MNAPRTHGRILIDLLRSTNGGPVATEIIRGVLWANEADEPEDWIESVRHLVYTTGPRFGVRISAITRAGFAGYSVNG